MPTQWVSLKYLRYTINYKICAKIFSSFLGSSQSCKYYFHPNKSFNFSVYHFPSWVFFFKLISDYRITNPLPVSSWTFNMLLTSLMTWSEELWDFQDVSFSIFTFLYTRCAYRLEMVVPQLRQRRVYWWCTSAPPLHHPSSHLTSLILRPPFWRPRSLGSSSCLTSGPRTVTQ